MAQHTYTVAIPTRILVTVYSADSEADAIGQAQEMVDSLNDRDVQFEMNGGHVFFEYPSFDDAPITAEHDAQCLSIEHEE